MPRRAMPLGRQNDCADAHDHECCARLRRRDESHSRASVGTSHPATGLQMSHGAAFGGGRSPKAERPLFDGL